MMKALSKILISLSLMMLSSAFAVDRALLIGIGKYQNQIEDLPGVSVDIENMRQSAQLMGYDESQIKVMMNEQVTLANLKKTLKSWLIEGTAADDRVLIYFSGHGSRIPDANGDEKDGADEVLVMYDSQIIKKNNKKTISNALLDDDLNRYLKQIKSQDVMLLVDACNSGTVYRGFVGREQSEAVYPKFLSYSGIPKKNKAIRISESEDNPLDSDTSPSGTFQFVALTAAGDNELALATKNGSLFTSGIKYYLQQAARSGETITPKQLSEKVADYIQDKVRQEKLGAVYRPQLAGNINLVNKSIRVNPILVGENWKVLESLSAVDKQLRLYPNRSDLQIGDILEIQIDIPEAGYLNVINIDPSDSIFIVYPSSPQMNNWVKPGHLTIPTPEMGYQLQLTEPSGDNLFLAFLSKQPINAYLGQENMNSISGQRMSELFDRYKSEGFTAGKLVLEIKNAQ